MELDQMTLEELWKLFPIILGDQQPIFVTQYRVEEQHLQALLQGHIKRISHIDSTAIMDIQTKPIVDILIEVSNHHEMNIVKDILLVNQYLLMNESKQKLSFNKGYTIKGYADKVFHIHVKLWRDCDELYFRDYLNEHKESAKEYEQLKKQLYQKYAPNRNLYTEGKKEFVTHIVKLAKEEYKNRY